MEAPESARSLLRASTHGVLATLGLDPVGGFPFTSAVPYCLDADGMPLLLISRLARHTSHASADNRVSLFVQESLPGKDIQASPRLCLSGHLLPVPDSGLLAAADRYYRFFPQCNGFHRELDFRFFRLEPVRAHFIAGFARVCWLEAEELVQRNPLAPEAEGEIVRHMNEDHAEALPCYWRQAGRLVTGSEALVMAGVDSSGFHLRSGNEIVYIPFPRRVQSPADVRSALIALLSSARAGESAS